MSETGPRSSLCGRMSDAVPGGAILRGEGLHLASLRVLAGAGSFVPSRWYFCFMEIGDAPEQNASCEPSTPRTAFGFLCLSDLLLENLKPPNPPPSRPR